MGVEKCQRFPFQILQDSQTVQSSRFSSEVKFRQFTPNSCFNFILIFEVIFEVKGYIQTFEFISEL